MTATPHQHPHNRAPALGARSVAEFERAKNVTPGGSMRNSPYFPPHPPYASAGAGCRVTDLDGRSVLDCANNFFSLIHGHAFPPVIAALHRVLDGGTAFGLPTTAETELALAIRQRSPRLEQVRFTCSGTEAVMFAIKAARAITGRPAIAKFEGAYHGAYDHVEVSLDPAPEQWGEGDPGVVAYARGTPPAVLADTLVLPYNDPARCRRLIEREASRLAAIIIDPVASRVGLIPATAELRDVLQECCRRLGILLVMDEVVAFRLGHGGGFAAFGFEPDLVALGKIIGGGLPVGAVAGPARHMAVFDHTKGKAAVAHGGTFASNPLTMTAGLVALQHYDAAAIRRLDERGEALRASIAEQFDRRNLPAQITGHGSLFRLHLTRDPITDYRSCYPGEAARRARAAIHFGLLERGFLLTPNCSGALSTPMSRTDIDDLAAAIGETVAEIHAVSPWEQGRGA